MAKLRVVIARIVICLVLPQMLFVGCSIIGALIGASTSSDNRIDIALLTTGAITPGTSLVVTRRDSAVVRGEFLSLMRGDEPTYREEYLAEAHNLEDINLLPLPGDSLRFVYGVPGGTYVGRGRFLGVDPGTLLVVGMRSRPESVVRFVLDSLSSLHIEEKGDVDLPWLRTLISMKYLPWVSTHLSLRAEGGTTVFVALGDIIALEVDRANTAWLVGMGIGCVVDLAVLAAAAGSVKGCDTQTTGCKTQKAR